MAKKWTPEQREQYYKRKLRQHEKEDRAFDKTIGGLTHTSPWWWEENKKSTYKRRRKNKGR